MPIFSDKEPNLPFFVGLTATMLLPDLSNSSAITSVGFPIEYRPLAPSEDFAQENFRITFKVGNDDTKYLDHAVTSLDCNGTSVALSNIVAYIFTFNAMISPPAMLVT